MNLPAKLAMALREFADAVGRRWQVWDTYPAKPARPGGARQDVRESYAAGWLTFMAGTDRRRLTPIPEDWSHRDEAGLRTLLGQAAIAPPARRLP